jgi:sugar phosphate isomerase/epimerase
MYTISRRQACKTIAAAASVLVARGATAESPPERKKMKRHFSLASALYGTMPLDAILPEVHNSGAEVLDIWSLPHGDQREQIDRIGANAVAALLSKHEVELGLFTSYPLGVFKLEEEMKLVQRLGGRMIVTGSGGPKDPAGESAKKEVKIFLELMKPHAAAAEAAGLTIAIENHLESLLSHPDSLRYFADFNRLPNLGVAFAPHHLHDHVPEIPDLIEHLGKNLVFFYAQEYGKGFTKKLPKDEEMMQLPGFGGGLDYRPVLAALSRIQYQGWIEILMHPTPRGVAILPTATEITAAVNKSRAYLESCLPPR